MYFIISQVANGPAFPAIGKIHVYIYKGGCDQNFYQLLFVALINAGSLQLMEFLMPEKEVLLNPPFSFLGP